MCRVSKASRCATGKIVMGNGKTVFCNGYWVVKQQLVFSVLGYVDTFKMHLSPFTKVKIYKFHEDEANAMLQIK